MQENFRVGARPVSGYFFFDIFVKRARNYRRTAVHDIHIRIAPGCRGCFFYWALITTFWSMEAFLVVEGSLRSSTTSIGPVVILPVSIVPV